VSRRRREEREETQEFEVRVLFELEKSWKCQFIDDSIRLVPKKMIVSADGGAPEDMRAGTSCTLEVTQWIADRWAEEEPEPEETFTVPDAMVMRASERGIQVQAPSIPQPLWIPRSGVHPKSEVQEDGEDGELLLHLWAAKMKGLVGTDPPRQRRIDDDIRAPPSRPSKDAPYAGPEPPGEGPGEGDDDIPF
jgi:hypothetical protein